MPELKRRVSLGLGALVLTLLLVPRTSQAMTVSPPTLDFTLNPGDVIADVVQVYNEEGVPFKVTPAAVNFYVASGDEVTGAPEFYGADEVRNGHELAPWLSFNDSPTVIPPDERINIPFMIRVPENAEPGGHFGAIQIMTEKPDDIVRPETSNVGLQRVITVLIFVRVTGDVRDELTVSEFKTQHDVLSHLPADFTIRLNNEGTTHQRPVGNVIIQDMFGREVAVLQVNPGPPFKSVLPGSIRRFDASWFHRNLPDDAGEYARQLRNFAFGKYTATLLINYGSADAQKHLTAVTTFWVIPWLALLTYVAAGLIALLILMGLIRIYNGMLIRRYETLKKKGKI